MTGSDSMKDLTDRYRRKNKFNKTYNPLKLKREIQENRVKNFNMIDNFILSELEKELHKLKEKHTEDLPTIIHTFEQELEKIKKR